MEKTFAIVGLGTFGYKLCEVLGEKGATVIALDNDPALADRVRPIVTQAVLVDATDQEAIGNAPLEDVDVAVVAIGDNIEASVLTTALLKEQAVPYVVARAVSELHQKVLQRVGADVRAQRFQHVFGSTQRFGVNGSVADVLDSELQCRSTVLAPVRAYSRQIAIIIGIAVTAPAAVVVAVVKGHPRNA